MELYEKVLNKKSIFNGKIINLHVEDIELPDNTTSTREIVEHPGGVCILAVTDENEILMVKQFRSGPKEVMLEIPAGKLEYGEDPYECALREVEEETGYVPGKLSLICDFCSSPGFTNERIYLYHAEKLVKKQQKLDDDEFLEIYKYKIEDLELMLKNNELKDAKTIIAIQYAKSLM